MASRKTIIKSFIIFSLLVLFGRGANAAGLSVKQGEVFFYPIAKSSYTATFGGEKIPVFEYNNKSYVLVAADVSKKVGNYNLRIKSAATELAKKSVSVQKGSYKQTVRGVAYQFATLPPSEQEAVVKDKSELVNILADVI